eukprot:4741781-Prymnesium_polylepis.1
MSEMIPFPGPGDHSTWRQHCSCWVVAQQTAEIVPESLCVALRSALIKSLSSPLCDMGTWKVTWSTGVKGTRPLTSYLG